MKPIDPRLVRRSRTVRRFLLTCGVLSLVTAVALVAQAWFVADAVTRLFEGRPVLAAATALGVVLALRGLLAWAYAVASARAAVGVRTGLRHELLDAVVDPRRVGGLPESARFSALVGDGLDRLDTYVGRFLPQLVSTVLTPVVVVVALAWVDLLAAVVVVLTVPLVVVFLVLVGLVTRDRLDRRWGELARLGRHFSDVLDGLVVLKVHGRRQERGLTELGDRHRRATVESLRTAFLSSLVLELFSTLSVAIVAVATGLRIVTGDVPLEVGLFVLVLAPEAYLPLRRLGAHFHDSADGVTVAQDALDVLEAGRHSGWAPPPASADLVLDGVEVTYPGRTMPALRVDGLVVEPGDFLAVTGPSGCGKSTLLALLLGFVSPSRGRVRVGSWDLETLDVERWRSQVAWVPQVPGLLAGTVAENVRLGDPDASDDDVRRALADAGAADLDPARVLEEAGSSLSAGERRRVGIARALVRVRSGRASLLLLDEPTAGLDAARESTVLGALCGLDATVVVVSHRAETLRAAARVLRLQPVASASPAGDGGA